MGDLNSNAQKAMKLLGDGNIDEARSFVEARLAALEDERSQLYKIKSLIPEKNRPVSPKPIFQKRGGTRLTKEERREEIKKYANKVGGRQSGKVTVQEVADELKANGVDLGVAVPNTAIANVLMRSGNWRRLEKGVFQFNG